MTRPSDQRVAPDVDGEDAAVAFSALLEDSVEDLYDRAPCGYLSTLLDGEIAKVNSTLLDWLGYRREELVGRRYLVDLLTVGGKLYHETHYAPMLRMHGQAREIALDLVAADGQRLPVLVTAQVKNGSDGQQQLIRLTVFDARERRSYERELVRARQEAERDREQHRRLTEALRRTLLPPTLPSLPGLEVAAHYRAANSDEVGGDFYDVYPLCGGDRLGFFVGDVSGRGPAAAELTSVARYALRGAAITESGPSAALGRLNEVLRGQRDGVPEFCTAVVGVLRPVDDGFALALASGGHPPALVVRADGAVEVLHTPGAQLVGLLAAPRFTRRTARLAVGDVLVLHTDGLGDDLLDGVRPGSARDVVDELAERLAGSGGKDDAAVLAFGVGPA
ncbi:PP2C family protein-serine/threonine phosphatase [Actinosynnema mirum]|uniref:Putative PAS/PAC sensor protein n=1 Tax=Actinosynnema mirum (strain ATCC 29888 / DSM 43827 / JCM 3225 / NBRC 14064 / NCIMB 13271 / NRRL B-12336 / IMRU 3971 / 101) TaxID=446462 RepID=C6WED1_ACTMD|nr:SpoIIE family protein phosphatase [Actinosynnema mirum]ACU37731.1 putative PAS/PAC sensor protein [Actinosynnema mirum DSM 43827]AXX31160.1 Serine phosphatase RsbU, regulator of sigma subunit [Actinosynnema pretiosum subsp. pretiosum]